MAPGSKNYTTQNLSLILWLIAQTNPSQANPGHIKPWTRQPLDTTNPGYDKSWTQQILGTVGNVRSKAMLELVRYCRVQGLFCPVFVLSRVCRVQSLSCPGVVVTRVCRVHGLSVYCKTEYLRLIC
jgi:hypothetical protein